MSRTIETSNVAAVVDDKKNNEKMNESGDAESSDIDTEDKWLIRDCELYKDEYKECTSFRGRFHQLFIYGETLDCRQWKRDYNNCCKWTENKDLKAAILLSEDVGVISLQHPHLSYAQTAEAANMEAVISSEKARRLERLRGHYGNNTWKRRESPPSDWDKPLPEWMVKRDQNTFLAQKAQEIREGKLEDGKSGFCSIM